LKKRSKKLSVLWEFARKTPQPAVNESFFASFFSKKEALAFAPGPLGEFQNMKSLSQHFATTAAARTSAAFGRGVAASRDGADAAVSPRRGETLNSS
jgi:hypothetical protein